MRFVRKHFLTMGKLSFRSTIITLVIKTLVLAIESDFYINYCIRDDRRLPCVFFQGSEIRNYALFLEVTVHL